MNKRYWIEDSISEIAGKLQICSECPLRMSGGDRDYSLPERKAVHTVLDNFIGILFPGCHGYGVTLSGKVDAHLKGELAKTSIVLQEQVEMALEFERIINNEESNDSRNRARDIAHNLVEALPEIQMMLQDDIQAAYDGDPAANSRMEIMMSYPAIQAIATHRIAHQLYSDGVPLIPRIMSELSHSRTGIDIHPGAQIGNSFFIDHGTGVVIGETSIIGDHVKIYQGVTLGAMSFPKDENGNPIKGI